ncbi:hypothetical protein TSH7_01240 [Azospirillum sp. TSH7]|uniref:hypothetical protein n=1 Tax=unclassified Azospirillum TaxID=2630922 RepID=UPI000D604F89|nr:MULTISPECIES: hypothetical protein [unclassified Azospirillum]PWC69098.1 hypothetical protein TSH7_01240 [Azospirillum sp. TSH7]PWC71410.1 hypothetical protein TSH20_03835 [Azospirillum sp. TSH20]
MNWLADLAEEDPDAAELLAARQKDQDPPVRPLPWCQWAWRAWHRLKDERQWRGWGMGPAAACGIPYSAVASYADRHGHDADALYDLIAAMDAVYLEWMVEQDAAREDG